MSQTVLNPTQHEEQCFWQGHQHPVTQHTKQDGSSSHDHHRLSPLSKPEAHAVQEHDCFKDEDASLQSNPILTFQSKPQLRFLQDTLV